MNLFPATKRPTAARAVSASYVRGLEGMVAAIERSQAVIEFELDGTIVRANQNFLDTVGYAAEEVVGRRHAMFVSPDEAASRDYRQFWETLNRGEFVAAKFQRVGKDGREVWIQASYNPILDEAGRPTRVVKFAADVTAVEQERRRFDAERSAADRQQTQVVNVLADGLQRLSEGDLTTRIDAEFPGVYARVRNDFNHTAESLRGALSAVLAAAGAIRTGADEISTAADDLSQRTEQQAAGLEKTAGALDEMTAAVKRSAEGARDASAAASEARAEAERSGGVVREAVDAIHDIQQSSNQITQIIGVIDEIAFQTNLLALNAGVEAARAGEAGRGFAVVAQEVRALAQRSASAAREIKTLISSSGAQVDRGVRLVTDTGKALDAIMSRVASIDERVSEIAAAAQEQSADLGEVNVAVGQMDQVTQRNAAMVEQATAASAQLKHEATELGQLVGRFRVGAPAAQAVQPVAVPLPSSRKVRAVAGSAPALQEWSEF